MPAPQDIRVLGAVELIRSRPAMFFENGVATMAQLLAAVTNDAREANARNVETLRDGDFAMVCAERDWLSAAELPLVDLFSRFVLPPANRPNTHRAEVLLAAVCDGVCTNGEGGDLNLGLELAELPEHFADKAKRAKRFVAWRFIENARGMKP